MKFSHEKFTARVHKFEPHLEFTTKYTGALEPITGHCKLCDTTLTMVASKFTNRKGRCPGCVNQKKLIKLQERFDASNLQVTLHGPYRSTAAKIKFTCRKCGRQGEMRLSSLMDLYGRGTCSRHCQELEELHKQHDILVQKIRKLSGNSVELIQYFKGYEPTVKLKCLDCGLQYDSPSDDIKLCPQCSAE